MACPGVLVYCGPAALHCMGSPLCSAPLGTTHCVQRRQWSHTLAADVLVEALFLYLFLVTLQ